MGFKWETRSDSKRESMVEEEPERKTQNQEDGSKVISSKIILKGKRPFKLVDRLLKSSQIQIKLTWWFWQYFHFCSEKNFSHYQNLNYQMYLNMKRRETKKGSVLFLLLPATAMLTLIAVISWPHIWHHLGIQFPKSINKTCIRTRTSKDNWWSYNSHCKHEPPLSVFFHWHHNIRARRKLRDYLVPPLYYTSVTTRAQGGNRRDLPSIPQHVSCRARFSTQTPTPCVVFYTHWVSVNALKPTWKQVIPEDNHVGCIMD